MSIDGSGHGPGCDDGYREGFAHGYVQALSRAIDELNGVYGEVCQEQPSAQAANNRLLALNSLRIAQQRLRRLRESSKQGQGR